LALDSDNLGVRGRPNLNRGIPVRPRPGRCNNAASAADVVPARHGVALSGYEPCGGRGRRTQIRASSRGYDLEIINIPGDDEAKQEATARARIEKGGIDAVYGFSRWRLHGRPASETIPETCSTSKSVRQERQATSRFLECGTWTCRVRWPTSKRSAARSTGAASAETWLSKPAVLPRTTRSSGTATRS
jgi:hypothetical protein